MKNIKRITVFAFFAILALAFGLTVSRHLDVTEAQNVKPDETNKTKSWKHNEKSLRKVNSKYGLNLPDFPEDSEWLVAVKPIEKGKKEKMYIGVFSYENPKDTAGEKMGLKELSQMEDYPENLTKVVDGEITLKSPINPNQILTVYMEVEPSTKLSFTQSGKKIDFDVSDESFFIYNGEIEKSEVKNTASLIVKANLKQAEKDLAKRGITLINRQEEK